MKNHTSIKISTAIIVLLTLATLVSCDKETNEEKQTLTNGPMWRMTNDYDYSSSMTAIVSVDVSSENETTTNQWHTTTNDLMAAFADSVCVGVAECTDGLFYLYITKPKTDNIPNISLYYYSAMLNATFCAPDVFPYANDSRQGSTDNPLRPVFTVVE